jgi:hypothetical protein
MRGQILKIAVLMVLVVIGGWYVWKGFGSGEGPGALWKSQRSDEAESLPEIQPVQLGLLNAKLADYDPRGRNLFRYAKPPPTAEEIRAREEAARRAQEEAERRRREAEEAKRRAREAAEKDAQRAAEVAEAKAAEPARPKPPEIRLSYMGYVGPLKERVAVLLDPEGEILVAKEGEVVEEHFRVLRIGYSYLEMGYVNFDGSKPLPLGGGESGGRS